MKRTVLVSAVLSLGATGLSPVPSSAQLDRITVQQGCGFDLEQTVFRTQEKKEVHLLFGDLAQPDEALAAQLATSKDGWRELSKSVRERIRDQVGRLGQVKSAQKRIISLLSNADDKKKIIWIGADFSQKVNAAELFSNLEKAEKTMARSGLKPDEIRNQSTLILGALFSTLYYESKLRGKAKVLVLDRAVQADLLELEAKLATENEAQIRALMEAVPRSGLVTSDLEKLTEEVSVSLYSVEEPDAEQIQKTLKKSRPPMKKMIQDYVAWSKSNVLRFQKHYSEIAKQLLGYKASGIAILRSRLSAGVKAELIQSCPKGTK